MKSMQAILDCLVLAIVWRTEMQRRPGEIFIKTGPGSSVKVKKF